MNETINKIRNTGSGMPSSSQALTWLQERTGNGSIAHPLKGVSHLDNPLLNREECTEEDERRSRALNDLQRQQVEIQRQIQDLTLEEPKKKEDDLGEVIRGMLIGRNNPKTEQEILLEQIKAALAPKDTPKDPNKTLLRALITGHNKTMGAGGTSTLKPDIINRLTGEGEFSMAEWLASLNKQEEGESEVTRLLSRLDDDSDCRPECKHNKMKSGMLDKSTTNIRHKET